MQKLNISSISCNYPYTQSIENLFNNSYNDFYDTNNQSTHTSDGSSGINYSIPTTYTINLKKGVPKNIKFIKQTSSTSYAWLKSCSVYGLNGSTEILIKSFSNLTSIYTNGYTELDISSNSQGYSTIIVKVNSVGGTWTDDEAYSELEVYGDIPITTKYLISDKNNILYTSNGGGGYVDSLPTMTSNTAPSGVASASTIYSTTYDAYKAFNKTNADNADCWITVNGTITGWLKYDFGSGKEKNIQKYVLSSRNYTDYNSTPPKSWTFEGSDDNTNWTILDKRVNETGWTQSEKRIYDFTNDTKYRYYRINITENNGSLAYTCIGELEFYEKIECELDVLNTTTLSDTLFINKGITDPTVLNNQKPTIRGVYGQDNGTLGTGKYFSTPFTSDYKSINTININ